MSLEEFERDAKTRYAVQMALMDHGRSRRGTANRDAGAPPGCALAGLADIGNTFRHQYWAVEHQITWTGLQHELAPLEKASRTELARLGGSSGPSKDKGS